MPLYHVYSMAPPKRCQEPDFEWELPSIIIVFYVTVSRRCYIFIVAAIIGRIITSGTKTYHCSPLPDIVMPGNRLDPDLHIMDRTVHSFDIVTHT